MSGTKSPVTFICLLLAAVLAAATGCATPKYRVVEEEDPVTHVVNRYRLPANAYTGKELEQMRRERENMKREEAAKAEQEERERLKKAPLWVRVVWPYLKPYCKPRELVPPPGCRPIRRKKAVPWRGSGKAPLAPAAGGGRHLRPRGPSNRFRRGRPSRGG